MGLGWILGLRRTGTETGFAGDWLAGFPGAHLHLVGNGDLARAFDLPIPGPRYLTSTLGGGGLRQAARVASPVLRTRPNSMGPEGE